MGRGKIIAGKAAEERACQYLKDRGYRILDRNIRSAYGEIDIIARRDDTLAVVEVRSKKRWSSVSSSEIVGFRKRKNVVKVAREVIGIYRKRDDSIRFDVIIVTTDEQDYPVDIDHLENAFSARGEII